MGIKNVEKKKKNFRVENAESLFSVCRRRNLPIDTIEFQLSKYVTWLFTPSQPVPFYQGDTITA